MTMHVHNKNLTHVMYNVAMYNVAIIENFRNAITMITGKYHSCINVSQIFPQISLN